MHGRTPGSWRQHGQLLFCLLLIAALLPRTAMAAGPPSLMLAQDYRGDVAVQAYWISEKLDGVRGRWDGLRLWTRAGTAIATPDWFTAGWPKEAMDGELWLGRGRFEETSALIRRHQPRDPAWKEMRFMVFDLPLQGGPFDARIARMRGLLPGSRVPWLQMIEQFRLDDAVQLEARLRQVVRAGGEGLMLHRHDALYQPGRSDALLKYKPYQDDDARVIAHAPGKGKYQGMLGALLVEHDDGRRFRLGSGFTDAQRAHPPPLGSRVTYRYNGLTRLGQPRFARFLRVREEAPIPADR